MITNIDADHLDYYKNAENYMEAFVKFVSRVKRAIVLSGEDPGCRAVYERVAPEIRDRLEWYFVSRDVCETAQGDRIPLPGLDLQVR